MDEFLCVTVLKQDRTFIMKTLLFLVFGNGKRGRPREEALNLDEVLDGEMRVAPTPQRAEEIETHPSGRLWLGNKSLYTGLQNNS